MRDKSSFHCPEPRFISRGAADGNKHGQGWWLLPVSRNNHTITVLLYLYNTFMSVYLHLLSFIWLYESLMWPCCARIMPWFVFCLFLKNFCRNLVKTLPIIASRRNKCFITYAYFVLITDSQVHNKLYERGLDYGKRRCGISFSLSGHAH